MVDKDKVAEELEQCGAERVELPKHVYDRARRRNINPEDLEDKIMDKDFESVKINHQADIKFEKSYKVKIELEGVLVEVPIYFNVPGPYILVKSIWRG